MVDDFRPDNGATRFVPGSHRWTETPAQVLADCAAPHADEVITCGPAGSLILFDASTWHGYTANSSSSGRRSMQGTFIPRSGRAATDFLARMQPSTFARLSATACEVIGIESAIHAPPV